MLGPDKLYLVESRLSPVARKYNAADHDALLSLRQRGSAECAADVACNALVERLVDDAADVIGLEDRFGESNHGFLGKLSANRHDGPDGKASAQIKRLTT